MLESSFSNGTLFAYSALVLLLLALSVKQMLPLRTLMILAAGSFTAYAFFQSEIVLILAGLAGLAVSIFRFFEVQNTSRKIRRTRHYGYKIENLLPIMREIEVPAGELIFAKGEIADRLYVPVEGNVEIVENGAKIQTGELFGEFGLFSGTGTRTMSARCITDCKFRTMTAREVDNLYFTQPEFALALVKIMATRMTNNIERLQNELAAK